jgi:DNA-binding NarL/FixJ family response regulator
MIRVLIADDQDLVRAGFRQILAAEDDIEVVADVGDGAAAVAACRSLGPDVALLDIRMPGMDGIDAARRVAALDRTIHILILTTFGSDDYVFAALEAGATGFLLKDAGAQQLVDAVRIVARGDALLAPAITKRLIELSLLERWAALTRQDDADIGRLTEREAAVLTELARGLSNTEIGAALHVSEATVKTHVAQILSKLGVRSRVQAVIRAYQSGFIPLPGGRHHP